MTKSLNSIATTPFQGVADLTRHVFDKRGVELSTIRRMIFVGNIEGLVETICLLLEQHHAEDSLAPGTRHTRSTSEESLGINKGCIPLDHMYSGLFYFLCQGNHLDILDIFRILRSRTDWTSETFRSAVTDSEFRKYRLRLYQEYTHIPRSMYYHHLLAKIFELTFNPATGDAFWMWVTPPTDPETGELSYQMISTPDKESYDDMLRELNTRLVDAFYYSGNAKALEYFFAPHNHQIDPRLNPKDRYDKTYGLNYVPHPVVLSIVVARRYFTSYLYVPYYRQMANKFREELAPIVESLASPSSPSSPSTPTQDQPQDDIHDLDAMMSTMIQLDPKVQQEKVEHYNRLIASYEWAANEHLAFFKQFVKYFGIDLCYTHDITAVLVAAQFEREHDIITLLQSFGIDLEIVNSYQFSHARHRSKLMVNPSLLAMILEARKDENRTISVANILLIFTLYNLTSFMTRILDEPENETITLSDLSRKQVNFLTLACESPIVTYDTVRFLLKHRCKIYSNSKVSNKHNVFLALFMSRHACPRSRMAIAEHILNITRKSSDYMPALTVDEWVSILRSIAHRRLFTLEEYSQIITTATSLVPDDVIRMMYSNPPVYLRHVGEALEFSYFAATLDVFSFPPFYYDIWQRDMLATVQALFPPEHGHPLCVALSQTGDIITYLINTRATDALQYMIRIGYVPTTSDMKSLALSNGFVVDPHDCNFGHLLQRSKSEWWALLMDSSVEEPRSQYYLPNMKSIEVDRIAFALDCDYFFPSEHEKNAHELYNGIDTNLQQDVILYSQNHYNIRSHYTKPYSIAAAIAETRAMFQKKNPTEAAKETQQSQHFKPLLTPEEDDIASLFLQKIIAAFEDDNMKRYNEYKARRGDISSLALSTSTLPGTPSVLRPDQVNQGPLGLGNHYEHGYSTFLLCFHMMRRAYPDFEIAAPIILPKIGLTGANYLLLSIYALAYPDVLSDEASARSLAKVFVRHCNSTMLYSEAIIVELIINHIILHFDSSPEMTHLIETRQYDQIDITPEMHEQIVNFTLINFNHFVAEACRTKDFGFGSFSFFQLIFERTRWMPHIFLKRVLSPDTAMLTQDGGIFLNIMDQFVALHGSGTLFVEEYYQCAQPLRWLAIIVLNSSITEQQRYKLAEIIGHPLELSYLSHYLGFPSLQKQLVKGGALVAAVGAVGAAAWWVIKNYTPDEQARESIISSITSYIFSFTTSSSNGSESGSSTSHISSIEHESISSEPDTAEDHLYRRY